MNIKILFFLVVVHLVQCTENTNNFTFFLTLGEMEDPLRNENQKFEVCYKMVGEDFEKALKTALNSLTKAETEVSTVLRNYIDSRRRAVFGTQLLKNAIENLLKFLGKLKTLVEQRQYRDAASALFEKRKEVEFENSKFDSWMMGVEKKYPDPAKKAKEIVNKIRLTTISDTRSIATNFTICIEETTCNPYAGYKLV